MIRNVTRFVLIVLLLQLTNSSNLLTLAQTRKAANSAPSKEELKQFDEFVERQMKLD